MQESQSVSLHRKLKGKISIRPNISIKTTRELSLVYTPGVAAVSKEIQKDVSKSFDLTWRGRTIAVVSDGPAVLGLGNIGPEAALPVMEGKAMLLSEFGKVNAVPIVLNTQDPIEIIQFVKHIAPSFAGIMLEDISAPRCFQIEEELQNIGIPVYHDDQHGTATVVMAALINASLVVGKKFEDLNVVVVGAGAAGIAVTKMLLGLECGSGTCAFLPDRKRVNDVIVCDREGALVIGRTNQNIYKQAIAGVSNHNRKSGKPVEIIEGADVVIGVSGPGNITEEMISKMNRDPIVFAPANPTPEIMPDSAKKAGAKIVATGRSDFPNQINNLLIFPGIFRAVIDGRLKIITHEMKEKAAMTLASFVKKPDEHHIIPDPFTEQLAEIISKQLLNI